jgi:phage FluMu gp28-like protein
LTEILVETLYFCFTRNGISHLYFHANQTQYFRQVEIEFEISKLRYWFRSNIMYFFKHSFQLDRKSR